MCDQSDVCEHGLDLKSALEGAQRELTTLRVEAYKARVRMDMAVQLLGQVKIEREMARVALEEIRGLPLAVDNATIGMTDKDLLERAGGIARRALEEMAVGCAGQAEIAGVKKEE